MKGKHKIGRIKHVGDIDSNIIGIWVRPIGEEELVSVYMDKSLFSRMYQYVLFTITALSV